ncbi:MAG: hypothetical protein N4A40_02535 [Tissierellales bacterium]|jgi:hypothetical protein|nr:hypothetical protein [Tissierellales bacterium]
MAVRFSIWDTSEEKATLTINKKKKILLKIVERQKEHTLYSGANKRFYVTSTYSGIPHVIMEFNSEEAAVEEFTARVEKVYEEI